MTGLEHGGGGFLGQDTGGRAHSDRHLAYGGAGRQGRRTRAHQHCRRRRHRKEG